MEPSDLERRRALSKAQHEVERLEREVATRSSESASAGELLFLLQRLELARKKLQALLDGRSAFGLLLVELLLR